MGICPLLSSPLSWHFRMPAIGRQVHVLPSLRLSHHLKLNSFWVTGTDNGKLLVSTPPQTTPALVPSMAHFPRVLAISACTSSLPTQTMDWVMSVDGFSRQTHSTQLGISIFTWAQSQVPA